MKIIAHRANDEIHKENTMEAILNSLKMPYIDGVEIDIRMTKDYNFVIHHDPFYAGYYIEKTSLKALQKKGLNSLEEVLEKINSNKILLIEIKEENKNKLLLIKLNKILKKYDLNYYLCSFNYELLKKLQQKYPKYKAGLIIGIKLNTNHLENNFDFNSVNYRHIEKAPKKETFVWTINNKETFNKVKNKGNIITDKAKEIYDLTNETSQA